MITQREDFERFLRVLAAQTLWHLDILSTHPITVPWRGMRVTIPSPEAYAAHKMAINGERGVKAEKDAHAVMGLWTHLNRERLDEVLAGLTKKERGRVDAFMESHGLE